MVHLGDGRIINTYADGQWSTTAGFRLLSDKDTPFADIDINDFEKYVAQDDFPTLQAALGVVLGALATYCAAEYQLTLELPG